MVFYSIVLKITRLTIDMSITEQIGSVKITLQNFYGSFLPTEMITTGFITAKDVLQLRVRIAMSNDLIGTIFKQIWFISEEPFDSS